MGLRALELFAGIGGFAAAAPRSSRVTAFDQSSLANWVYRANFAHEVVERELAGVTAAELPDADLWWMSPPCQPYTQRGEQRDLDDPRAASLKRVVWLIAERQPAWVALENVPGFRDSRAHGLLCATLDAAGYEIAQRTLCPTELGIPNRRPRFYLLASRVAEPSWGPPTPCGKRLGEYLDRDPDAELALDPEIESRYRDALRIVDVGDPEAVANCFTAAYGRSPVRSGSYLRNGDGARYFSPREILKLLHFPDYFRLPEGLSRRKAWGLVGNSLSVAAVREVIAPVVDWLKPPE